MLMTVAAAVPALSRLASPAPQTSSPSHHLQTHPPQSLKSAPLDIRTHIANLDRLLKPAPPFPAEDNAEVLPIAAAAPALSAAGKLFNALNISNLFLSLHPEDKKKSPRSLAHLHRLLSGSPRQSPRSSIASRWLLLHGADNWTGLLDPLDEHLRRELVRYGDFVQSAYTAFHSNTLSSPANFALSDRSYRVTRSLFATSPVDIPSWLKTSIPPWMTRPTSWIGFVAVCDNPREISRMGRRDIVISLRGTATALEWAENFRSGLHAIPADSSSAAVAAPKVSSGFWSLYKTAGSETPSLSSAVVDEVRRLVEIYKGEELSITVTGHSLGAALAQLVADELATEIQDSPPIAVVSFGGPRVGNRAFAERVEKKGVKVLRVVNAQDVVPRVPGVLPRVRDGGYAHVGVELRVDNRVSPYLKPDTDLASAHDLEAYLHLVDGFMGTGCPFRANAKRSLSRLLNQQLPNLKEISVSRPRPGELQALCSSGRASEVHQGYLASPSG
ncbi:hypothetical protein KSP39_PZI008026 [Platanthera zijinensis]|uniref:Fungal lipase-type domain-containing protein n=1 Tax=Platanthera zijinensis TaxID=2320716 RepID=A0AAP0G9C5_9ASPA